MGNFEPATKAKQTSNIILTYISLVKKEHEKKIIALNDKKRKDSKKGDRLSSFKSYRIFIILIISQMPMEI